MTTINLEFICPRCRVSLEQGSKSYYCKQCSKEYQYYVVNGLPIIDFKSLDTADCECNRDGKTDLKFFESRKARQNRHRVQNYERGMWQGA